MRDWDPRPKLGSVPGSHGASSFHPSGFVGFGTLEAGRFNSAAPHSRILAAPDSPISI